MTGVQTCALPIFTLPTFLTAGVSALVAYPVGLLSFSYGLELVLQVVLFAIAYVAISKILRSVHYRILFISCKVFFIENNA